MTMRQGYLVVLKSLPPSEVLYNLRYKGIDRTPSFSLEKYKEGFDDPYLFGGHTTTEGLIPTLSLAKEVLQRFSKIEEVENLEIIYVRTGEEVALGSDKPLELQFLGFDVAGDRPFWSIVNDSPPPDDPTYYRFLSRLNNQGLLESLQVAEEYLEAYLSHHPKKRNSGLKVWAVYLVPEHMSVPS